jgi:hypothetical protein
MPEENGKKTFTERLYKFRKIVGPNQTSTSQMINAVYRKMEDPPLPEQEPNDEKGSV